MAFQRWRVLIRFSCTLLCTCKMTCQLENALEPTVNKRQNVFCLQVVYVTVYLKMQVHFPRSNEQYSLEVLQTLKGCRAWHLRKKKLNFYPWLRQYDLEFMVAIGTNTKVNDSADWMPELHGFKFCKKPHPLHLRKLRVQFEPTAMFHEH